jgi:hypothetical protein
MSAAGHRGEERWFVHDDDPVVAVADREVIGHPRLARGLPVDPNRRSWDKGGVRAQRPRLLVDELTCGEHAVDLGGTQRGDSLDQVVPECEPGSLLGHP